jgi:hypothetical protein
MTLSALSMDALLDSSSQHYMVDIDDFGRLRIL